MYGQVCCIRPSRWATVPPPRWLPIRPHIWLPIRPCAIAERGRNHGLFPLTSRCSGSQAGLRTGSRTKGERPPALRWPPTQHLTAPGRPGSLPLRTSLVCGPALMSVDITNSCQARAIARPILRLLSGPSSLARWRGFGLDGALDAARRGHLRDGPADPFAYPADDGRVLKASRPRRRNTAKD